MAVSGIKGTGIGQVTQPYMGMGDESSGLTIGGEQPSMMPFGIDRLVDVLGGNIENLPPVTETVQPRQYDTGYQDEIMRIAESLKKTMPEKTTGSFQAGDTTRDQVDPTQSGQRNIGLSDDEEAAMAGADAGASEETIKDVTVTALQDYLDQARPGTQPKDYAEYIKEFSDATGLDVSGKPDKSTALMALGLSLMQNKAGKGFDVGKMLGAVGEAGEKALPEYQKAKSEARALRAKAGEYALGRRKEDEAKAQQRQFMYVVPKQGEGATEKDRLRNRLMRGRYIRVNASELNALDTNEGFNKGYEFLPADALTNMKDLFAAPDSPYAEGLETLTLFEDKDGPIEMKVRFPKAGFEHLPTRAASSNQVEDALRGLDNRRAKIDRTESRFTEFAESFSATPPSAVPQAITAVTEFTRALGFLPITNFKEAVEGENDVQKQKRFLQWVSTSYAPEILQEAGKTISDADRQRVNQLVGEIKLLSDPIAVAARVNQLHKLIIQSSRARLAEGYEKISAFSGGSEAPQLTKEQATELAELRKQVDSLLGK